VAKCVVEINDELLQETFAVLGTSSVTDAINRAFLQVRETAVQRAMADQALRRGGWTRVPSRRRRWFRR